MHAAGDRLLVTAADVLRRSQGPRDLLARLGGDEFVVLVHGCPAADVPALVSWLEQALGEHGIRASIGAAHLPQDAGSLDALVDRADEAMLAVKRRRRGTVPQPSVPALSSPINAPAHRSAASVER